MSKKWGKMQSTLIIKNLHILKYYFKSIFEKFLKIVCLSNFYSTFLKKWALLK
jgi:hypothetical protein